MSHLNDAEKRTFISEFILLMEHNAPLFIEKGYNPATKIAELKQLHKDAREAEAHQLKAEADKRDATRRAKETLKTAYEKTSAAVEIVSGLLGKGNSLKKEIKKMRNW
jgi:hypothetical protein